MLYTYLHSELPSSHVEMCIEKKWGREKLKRKLLHKQTKHPYLMMFWSLYCRLMKVRQRNEYDRRRPELGDHDSISLYGDYAIVAGTDLVLGSLQRVLLKGDHGAVDYLKPVTYTHEKRERLTAIVAVYSEVGHSDLGSYYEASGESRTFPFTSIMTHINMEFRDGQYFIAGTELAILKEKAVSKQGGKSKRKNSSRNETSVNATSGPTSINEASGIIVRTITPDTSQNDGMRRSSRKRTVKDSLSNYMW